MCYQHASQFQNCPLQTTNILCVATSTSFSSVNGKLELSGMAVSRGLRCPGSDLAARLERLHIARHDGILKVQFWAAMKPRDGRQERFSDPWSSTNYK